MQSEVERKEWLWVSAISVMLIVSSTLPYVAGYAAQTAERGFGEAVMSQADYHSHLAKMWQGYRGRWRYRLLFTPEEHHGAYLQTFYVALGHLARLTGTRLALVYQVARVTFSFLMLVSIYRFIAHFVSPVRTRRISFWLATTTSGLGWFTEVISPTPPGGVSPMDFWLLDGFTYLAMLTSPHFCVAVTLLLIILLLLLRPSAGPTVWESTLAVLVSLALGLVHPYMLLVVDLLPVLFWAAVWMLKGRINWQGIVTAVVMILAQLPLLAYDLWVFRTQPVFAEWSAQNVTLSPSPRVYLLGYGMLLVLGSIGVVTGVRRRRWKLAFPLLWCYGPQYLNGEWSD